jgi:hypothetical protein
MNMAQNHNFISNPDTETKALTLILLVILSVASYVKGVSMN